MGNYGSDYQGLYESSSRKSVSDSFVWISILAVVLAVIAWYGIKEGWFAGEASLHGFVVDDYNHAFTMASVALIDSKGDQAYTAGLSSDGKFEFADVKPGKYLLSVNTEYGKIPGGLDVFLKKNGKEEYKVIVPQQWFTEQKTAAQKAAQKQSSGGG
jgi:hypothetical protein